MQHTNIKMLKFTRFLFPSEEISLIFIFCLKKDYLWRYWRSLIRSIQRLAVIVQSDLVCSANAKRSVNQPETSHGPISAHRGNKPWKASSELTTSLWWHFSNKLLATFLRLHPRWRETGQDERGSSNTRYWSSANKKSWIHPCFHPSFFLANLNLYIEINFVGRCNNYIYRDRK